MDFDPRDVSENKMHNVQNVSWLFVNVSVLVAMFLIMRLLCWLQVSIPSIEGILILDNEGRRIAVKYYTSIFSQLQKQQSFEDQLVKKTRKSNAKSDGEQDPPLWIRTPNNLKSLQPR